MSIASEVSRIVNAVTASYNKVKARGGTVTSNKIADLPAAIDTIPKLKPEQTKTITIADNGQNTVIPDAGNALSAVVVNVAVPTWQGGSF